MQFVIFFNIETEDQTKKQKPKATASARRKHASKEQSAEDKTPVKPKTDPVSSKKTKKTPKTSSGTSSGEKVKKRGRPRKDSTPAPKKGKKAKEMPETEGSNEVTSPVPENPKERLNLDGVEEATASSAPKNRQLNLDHGDQEVHVIEDDSAVKAEDV